MSSNITGNNFIYLGKNTKKDRKLEAENFKGGIKRENIEKNNNLNDSQKARMLQIFDAIDNKKVSAGGKADGILDAEEIRDFWDLLTSAAGDEKLSGKNEINTVGSALGFDQNDNSTKLTQEELFQFLGEIANEMEDIESSEINDLGSIVVTHKPNENGSQLTEEFHEDGSKVVTNKFSSGNTLSYCLNANGVLVSEFDTETIDGVEKTTSILYEGEKGQEKPVSRTEEFGKERREYTYVDGQPQLNQIEQKLAEDVYKTIDFNRTEDGYIQTIKQDGQPTVREKYTNVEIENDTIPLLTQRCTVATENSPKVVETWDYERGIKQEDIVDERIGDATRNTYAMRLNDEGVIEYLQMSQLYVDTTNNKRYTVNYDENGNTVGVVVQRDETIEQIAQQYGCTVDALKEANRDLLNRQGQFDPATEIVIPGKVDAKKFGELGVNRKSANEIRAQIVKYQAYTQECNSRVLIEDINFNEVFPDIIFNNVYYEVDGPVVRNQYRQLGTNHLKQIAAYMFRFEDVRSVTPEQVQLRMDQIKRDNPGKFDDDGFLILSSICRDQTKKYWPSFGWVKNDLSLNLRFDPSYAKKLNREIDTTAAKEEMRKQESASLTGRVTAIHTKLIFDGYVENKDDFFAPKTDWGKYDPIKLIKSKITDTQSVADFFVELGELYTSRSLSEDDQVGPYLLDLLDKRCEELGLNNEDVKNLRQFNWKSSARGVPAKAVLAVAKDIVVLQSVTDSEKGEMLEEMKKPLNVQDTQNWINMGARVRKSAEDAAEALYNNPRGLFDRLYDAFTSEDEEIPKIIAEYKDKYDKVVKETEANGGTAEAFEKAFNKHFAPKTINQIRESLRQFTALVIQKQYIDIYNKALKMNPPAGQVDKRTKAQLIDDIVANGEPQFLKQMFELGSEGDQLTKDIRTKLETFNEASLRNIIENYQSFTQGVCGSQTNVPDFDSTVEMLYKDIFGADLNIGRRTENYLSARQHFSNTCMTIAEIGITVAATFIPGGLAVQALAVGTGTATLHLANYSSQNIDQGKSFVPTSEQFLDAGLTGLERGTTYYVGYGGGQYLKAAPTVMTAGKVFAANLGTATLMDLLRDGEITLESFGANSLSAFIGTASGYIGGKNAITEGEFTCRTAGAIGTYGATSTALGSAKQYWNRFTSTIKGFHREGSFGVFKDQVQDNVIATAGDIIGLSSNSEHENLQYYYDASRLRIPTNQNLYIQDEIPLVGNDGTVVGTFTPSPPSTLADINPNRAGSLNYQNSLIPNLGINYAALLPQNQYQFDLFNQTYGQGS